MDEDQVNKPMEVNQEEELEEEEIIALEGIEEPGNPRRSPDDVVCHERIDGFQRRLRLGRLNLCVFKRPAIVLKRLDGQGSAPAAAAAAGPSRGGPGPGGAPPAAVAGPSSTYRSRCCDDDREFEAYRGPCTALGKERLKRKYVMARREREFLEQERQVKAMAQERSLFEMLPSRSHQGLTAEEVEMLAKREVQKDKEELERHPKKPKENRVKLVKTKGETFQGSLDPITIFPEEVWDVILARVSTLDRLAVCRTNSQLDTAFGEFKNQWLFDQVLPFLMKHFTHKSQLLKCRKVCKKWRRTVNTFLESAHPCRRYYQKEHPVEQVICRMPTIYSSLRRCNLEHLQFTPNNMQKFSSCPYPNRPLIGRALSFQINGLWGDPEIDEFWSVARSFLESQGAVLWHFKFVQYNMHLTTYRFYLMLWECLNLLPNLKTLEIRCHLDKVHFSQDRETAQVIHANPLPVPENLYAVDIEGLPRVMQEHFITQFYSQLKRFSLDMDVHSDLDLPDNLVELCVRRVSSEEVLRKLYTMQTIPKECQKLTLDMSLCTRVQGPVLLEVLRQYPQLTHFRLLLHSRTSYVSQGSFTAKTSLVPTVEYFEIEGDGRDLFYFSTLLYAFPNLNYLHVRDTSYPGHDGSRQVRKYVTRDDVKVEIEQYLYANKVEESPIWDTLDELQVLTYESVNGSVKRFCTREQVKCYRERKAKEKE